MRRRRPRAAVRMCRQLQVDLLAGKPEHDAAVAGVVLEGVDALQAEPLLVEAEEVVEPVGRASEADGRDVSRVHTGARAPSR